MSFFSRRVPGLQKVFPASNISTLLPGEVSDAVQLVFPYPAGITRMAEAVLSQLTSAAANPPVLPIVTAGFDEYLEVLELSIAQGDALLHTFRLFLLAPNGGVVEIASQSSGAAQNVEQGLYASDAGGRGMGRQLPVYVPPGWTLETIGDAGGPYTLTSRAIFLSHPLAEEPIR